ncbi:hypothetical protein ZIOFF_038269 [Zingiber officinale]|uniref:RRM domain-containing protein n=1 Tax=Zingiber officinale TaxID=94328 RepID=A0A8J5KW85_ZINOF|nr:hypothetical protein ZIOFF_038269 [Zingiber officinale]
MGLFGSGPPSSPTSSASAPAVTTTISVGDNLLDANVSYFGSDGELQTVTISDLTKSKKAIFFIKKDLNIRDEVLLLSDGNREFTLALGVELDLSDKPMGLGVRSQCYALLAEDGVAKVLNLDTIALLGPLMWDSSSIMAVDYACTPEEVQQHFQSCGTVNRVTILIDRNGQPKGFAYVEFLEVEAIQEAFRLHESELHGRPIKVAAKRTNVPGLKQFVDKEAVAVTSVSRKATFYNGPSSMDFINVHDIFLECDHDSIIYLGKSVEPTIYDLLGDQEIEDPFERMENAARTVRWVELPKISNAFQNAHNKLSSDQWKGRDTILVDALSRRIPLVSDQPTIIFGADVIHPHPGEDSSPSIAVVVAS